ncbi:MAG: hypothetical protein HKL80_11165 [Acidimicrobiales bacterium]|nr:hypothetical protein [Acidimicrobiales bacterium]
MSTTAWFKLRPRLIYHNATKGWVVTAEFS